MSLAQAAQPLRATRPITMPRPVSALLTLNVTAVMIAALALRMLQLDHLPGINGDEAWYGIQSMRLVCGDEVAWRTPTNNILNPLYFAPLTALHLAGVPSAALLRWPAVVSGILALLVNYLLCRRVYDRSTAIITTMILAVLPVNIAYSRFGWDTSQTLLVTLPAVYLPLLAAKCVQHRQRYLILAGLAFAVSLVVHPTNIFTAPLLVIPALWAMRDELLCAWQAPRPRWLNQAGGCVCLATLCIVAYLGRGWLGVMTSRAASVDQMWEFAWHYERLFSGQTVYRFIAGSCFPEEGSSIDCGLLDLAWWSWLTFTACGVVGRLRQSFESRGMDLCLVAGWAAMVAGFFLVAGPSAIAPHYERYALCLIAPAAVLIGRGVGGWLGRFPSQPVVVAAFLSLAWLTLLGVQQHYFAFIQQTGGASHATFRTAAREPKQAVLEEVLQQRDPRVMSWIVTAEYWNELPLLYLASRHEHLRVENWSALQERSDLQAAAREGRVWFVEFAGSTQAETVQNYLELERLPYRESKIFDYAGNPVLVLFSPIPSRPGKAARNVED